MPGNFELCRFLDYLYRIMIAIWAILWVEKKKKAITTDECICFMNMEVNKFCQMLNNEY